MSTFEVVLVSIIAWLGFSATILLIFCVATRWDEFWDAQTDKRVRLEMEKAFRAPSVEPRRRVK